MHLLSLSPYFFVCFHFFLLLLLLFSAFLYSSCFCFSVSESEKVEDFCIVRESHYNCEHRCFYAMSHILLFSLLFAKIIHLLIERERKWRETSSTGELLFSSMDFLHIFFLTFFLSFTHFFLYAVSSSSRSVLLCVATSGVHFIHICDNRILECERWFLFWSDFFSSKIFFFRFRCIFMA